MEAEELFPERKLNCALAAEKRNKKTTEGKIYKNLRRGVFKFP